MIEVREEGLEKAKQVELKRFKKSSVWSFILQKIVFCPSLEDTGSIRVKISHEIFQRHILKTCKFFGIRIELLGFRICSFLSPYL